MKAAGCGASDVPQGGNAHRFRGQPCSKYQRTGGVSMYYVGIDIGKNNHVASMMDASRKTVFKAFALGL